MAILRRTPPPPVPVALMFRTRFDDLIVIRIPEDRISWFRRTGWHLLARDSDYPTELPEGHMYDPCLAFGYHPRPPKVNDEGDGA